MPYFYSSIGLGEKFSHYTINDADPHHIEQLSQINIFIGANNSGKSRFMRELSKLDATPYHLSGVDLQALDTRYEEFYAHISSELSNFINTHADYAQIEGFGRIDPNTVNLKTYIPSAYSKEYFNSNTKLEDLKKLLVALRDNQVNHNAYRGNPRQAVLDLKAKLSSNEGSEFINLLDAYIFDPINFKKYYIPTLRSLNDFDEYQNDPSQDIFALRTKLVYKYQEEDTVDVFTGQILYNRVKSMLLGDLEDRKRMRDYENFLSTKLFDGKEVVIIPKEKDDVVNVRIGGIEHPIHQLGDGIQSLIILTFPLFECENGIFFIEEPELNMHPGMQRKFMEAIQSRPQHQYFLTTHSNHLLDLTINYDNISVYTFKAKLGDPDSKKEVHLVTYGDRNILELIGAQNTSIFLANKTIWVEGVTDRLYISKYLELYIQNNNLVSPREDIDYTFVEYGGNNITHWSFLDSTDPTINVERLCGRLMLITDRDGNRKETRKAELASKLGDRYYLLSCNEIENSLSLKTLEKVIATYEGNTFTMPSGVNNQTRRTKNIGEFIEEDIFQKNGITITRTGGYKDSSGTLKQKLSFCHKAIKEMTYEDMSLDAMKLSSAVYNFISN
jgi:predicted ATP-dependent endonuclease of OLD family